MSESSAHAVSVHMGGKEIHVIPDPAKAHELNTALNDDAQFKTFAADPKAFVSRYGLHIDDDLAGALKTKLAGAHSLAAFSDDQGGNPCTAVAVAMGVWAVTDTKIAAVI